MDTLDSYSLSLPFATQISTKEKKPSQLAIAYLEFEGGRDLSSHLKIMYVPRIIGWVQMRTIYDLSGFLFSFPGRSFLHKNFINAYNEIVGSGGLPSH